MVSWGFKTDDALLSSRNGKVGWYLVCRIKSMLNEATSAAGVEQEQEQEQEQ